MKIIKIIILCITTILILYGSILYCLTEKVENNVDSRIQVQNDGLIKIAIIDSGISTLGIDSSKIATGYNYILKNNNTEDTIDHGTAIASIIVGSESARVKGISKNSILVPLVFKMFKEDGSLQTVDETTLAKIIYDAVDIYGCRIINLSLGIISPGEKLEQAIKYAEENNVVVVSSVGNAYKIDDKLVYYPAAYETVIGVGSHDEMKKISEFSMRNKSVMVVAQGEGEWYCNKDGLRFLPQGTSYATAVVTGHIAELLYNNKDMSPEEVRGKISQSTIDIMEEGYDEDSGYGVFLGF